MKLVLFDSESGTEMVPGLLTDRGVVDISDVVPRGHTPQLTMQSIIDGFEELRPRLN